MSELLPLGVVGCRDLADPDLFQRSMDCILRGVEASVQIVSGGARSDGQGADTFAAAYSRRVLRREPLEFYPEYSRYPGKVAPLQRNTQIAVAVRALVAFWDGISTGTWDTIQKCADLGKPVTVVLCPRVLPLPGQPYARDRCGPILKYAQLWTDASVSKKRGLYGCAYVARSAGKEREEAAAQPDDYVASPRAELESIRRALESFQANRRGLFVELVSDSEWSLEGLKAIQDQRLGLPVKTLSMYRYTHLREDMRPRLNQVQDLVEQFGYVKLRHVRGHTKLEDVQAGRISRTDHLMNNRCDALAVRAVENYAP